jgi:hypothetical protein
MSPVVAYNIYSTEFWNLPLVANAAMTNQDVKITKGKLEADKGWTSQE